LTRNDGLAHDRVRDVLEGRDGTIWFATFAGLNRYDGTSITTVDGDRGVPADSIWGLLEDSDGGLWLGTSGAGVGRFDGSVIQTMNAADGLSGNLVQALCTCHGGNV